MHQRSGDHDDDLHSWPDNDDISRDHHWSGRAQHDFFCSG
jgi:hypothetical protein